MRPLTTAAILLTSAVAGAAGLWLFQTSQVACRNDSPHPQIKPGTPEAAALQKATPQYERLFRIDMKNVRTHLEQPGWGDNKAYWYVVFEPSRGKTLAGCPIRDPKADWMAQVRKSDLKVMNAGDTH
jgi:hypothetical protein